MFPLSNRRCRATNPLLLLLYYYFIISSLEMPESQSILQTLNSVSTILKEEIFFQMLEWCLY